MAITINMGDFNSIASGFNFVCNSHLSTLIKGNAVQNLSSNYELLAADGVDMVGANLELQVPTTTLTRSAARSLAVGNIIEYGTAIAEILYQRFLSAMGGELARRTEITLAVTWFNNPDVKHLPLPKIGWGISPATQIAFTVSGENQNQPTGISYTGKALARIGMIGTAANGQRLRFESSKAASAIVLADLVTIANWGLD